MTPNPLPPLDFPHPDHTISVRVAVWGTWPHRRTIALALLRFAAGLLLPYRLHRAPRAPWWQFTLRPNQGGTLRARGGYGHWHPEPRP